MNELIEKLKIRNKKWEWVKTKNQTKNNKSKKELK